MLDVKLKIKCEHSAHWSALSTQRLRSGLRTFRSYKALPLNGLVAKPIRFPARVIVFSLRHIDVLQLQVFSVVPSARVNQISLKTRFLYTNFTSVTFFVISTDQT